jgi:hypothetical protein
MSDDPVVSIFGEEEICQFSFYRLLHTHHLSSGAGTVGKIVADVPSGLSLTLPQENKKKTT